MRRELGSSEGLGGELRGDVMSNAWLSVTLASNSLDLGMCEVILVIRPQLSPMVFDLTPSSGAWQPLLEASHSGSGHIKSSPPQEGKFQMLSHKSGVSEVCTAALARLCHSLLPESVMMQKKNASSKGGFPLWQPPKHKEGESQLHSRFQEPERL